MSPTAPTPALRDEIDVRRRHVRAANVERHDRVIDSGYLPTSRTLEVLGRISRSMANTTAGRAWSLTGPYGAGKSSFALFLHALLGPENDPRGEAARQTLTDTDPQLAAELDAALAVLTSSRHGFIRASVTAQREPITDTVLRALQHGAAARWGNRVPQPVRHALFEAEQDRTPRLISLALEALAEQSPVLLVIDEFGKNLEHFAEDPDNADLFVLQELAERCSGGHGLPAFLLTLQHLAFDDYVRGASALQRREWGKIQGRFEDVPFVESAEQSARLIAGTFTSESASQDFRSARSHWATAQTESCSSVGILNLLPGSADAIEPCYPLHPLTVLALPELCSRFGQHGRTLFSFLTGGEPHGVVEFLDTTPANDPLPSIGLPQLFDFFIGSGGLAGRHAARLTEIYTTIRDATGLTQTEEQLLKIVGVLNLLSQGGPLRASTAVLGYAMRTDSRTDPPDLETLIEGLQRRGLLTYRAFADEYRLWQGSDLDLPALIEQATDELSTVAAAELLRGQYEPPKVIAGRHSQRVGMLRYFDTVFADEHTTLITRPDTKDAADGLVVQYLGAPDQADQLQVSAGHKPVLLITTDQQASVVEKVRELAAVQRVLSRSDVVADPVARRELQESAADATRRLNERIASHLRPGAPGSQLRLYGSDVPLAAAHSLSPVLSTICDDVYSSSPVIRNEMLGRRELTSQGAKARRELLEAMVLRGDEEWLGFRGFGPEKAMYSALLRHTEIHRFANGVLGFHPPRVGDMANAWATMSYFLDQATDEPVSLGRLVDVLTAPPIGLKEGPIPVLLTALLLYRADDVAVYQEGTYQPAITPELLERLVKSPDRFAVRHFRVGGGHGRVIAAATTAAGAVSRPYTNARPKARGRRNTALLAAAAPLLSFARSLPEYTLRTRRLASDSEAVRDALLHSREPEELILAELPAAVGLDPFRGSLTGRDADIHLFQERLQVALEDLRDTYQGMIDDCLQVLAAELKTTGTIAETRTELRGQAASLTRSLIEPRLRSFVAIAVQDQLDDQAWVEAVANNLTTRPPASWRDDDFARFEVESRGIAGAYRRVLALHYEAAASQRAGFDAHRVTVTHPDGSEHSSVVWVDHATKAQIEAVMQEAREAAERITGPHGGQALLATLAESVLGGRHIEEPASHPSPNPRQEQRLA